MKWNDKAEYLIFRAAVGSLAVLPADWAGAVCRGVGRALGAGPGYRRALVTRQLATVFPAFTSGQIDSLTAAVYVHLGQTVAETFCTAPERLLDQVEIAPGWSVLDGAMATGRGVLVVTAHLGNFELGGRILATRYPVLDVVKPMRNPLFDRFLRQARARHGITTVPMDESGRAVLSHLRQGGLVTLLIDQDAGGEGVRTNFLGRPASTWPGAARLAVRTGCPLVPVAILRQADGHHVLHIGEAVDPEGATADPADIATLTARISAAVESFIYQQPEQWFWVHRRWKGAAEARKYDETR